MNINMTAISIIVSVVLGSLSGSAMAQFGGGFTSDRGHDGGPRGFNQNEHRGFHQGQDEYRRGRGFNIDANRITPTQAVIGGTVIGASGGAVVVGTGAGAGIGAAAAALISKGVVDDEDKGGESDAEARPLSKKQANIAKNKALFKEAGLREEDVGSEEAGDGDTAEPAGILKEGGAKKGKGKSVGFAIEDESVGAEKEHDDETDGPMNSKWKKRQAMTEAFAEGDPDQEQEADEKHEKIDEANKAWGKKKGPKKAKVKVGDQDEAYVDEKEKAKSDKEIQDENAAEVEANAKEKEGDADDDGRAAEVSAEEKNQSHEAEELTVADEGSEVVEETGEDDEDEG